METTFDLFVSHNGLDKAIVERLCMALLDAGVRPWFDKWDLAPGDVWLREIERVLEAVPAVIVCVGAHGFSAWHEAERIAALDAATTRRPGLVVPVLLPGAPESVELPVFLRSRKCVDLRSEPAWEPGIGQLTEALTGKTASHGPWIDEVRERPYRGLQPFTEADAGWMFGREQEEAALLAALRAGQRFITVVGASGSGKSSLVRRRSTGLPGVRTPTANVPSSPVMVLATGGGAWPLWLFRNISTGLVALSMSHSRTPAAGTPSGRSTRPLMPWAASAFAVSRAVFAATRSGAGSWTATSARGGGVWGGCSTRCGAVGVGGVGVEGGASACNRK